MNLDRRVEQYTRNTRDKLQGAHRPRSAKVFVEDNELNSYIKETGIQLVQLPNGITVIALARGTQDSIITSIETSTPNGAYCDPPDQPGLTHFAEHLLIPQQLSQHAGPLGVSLNASTSWRTLSQVAYGPLNPAYP